MKTLLLIISITFSLSSLACINDFDCGYGSSCTKPDKSYDVRGVCIKGTNNFNTTINTAKSCQFQSDCAYNQSCVKQNNQPYGVCSK
jgi:hypothetical protein